MAIAFFLVPGCGDKHLDKPLPQASERIKVELPWRDGGTIPRRYTCDGAQTKPAVHVSGRGGAPAASAIVMTDPDAPGGTFVHWTQWGARTGRNSFGKTGYSGPCPPKGDRPHRYVITVYSLPRPLRLPAGASPSEVVAAVRKGALASGSSTGTYGR